MFVVQWSGVQFGSIFPFCFLLFIDVLCCVLSLCCVEMCVVTKDDTMAGSQVTHRHSRNRTWKMKKREQRNTKIKLIERQREEDGMMGWNGMDEKIKKDKKKIIIQKDTNPF